MPPASGHTRASRRALVAGLLVLAAACGGPPMAPVDEGAAAPHPPPVRKAPRTIRVATLNVWAIPLFSDDLTERMARLGPAARDLEVDVLCLQEVFASGARRRVLADLGGAYRATRGAPGGLVVVSRLPVREETFTPFPSFAGLSLPERIAGKGMLEVVVETETGPLRVVTAHLALAFGGDNPRSRQLAFLLDRLDDASNHPTVLAADLNTPPVWDGGLTRDYMGIVERGWRATDPPVHLGGDRYAPPTPTRIGWPRPERPGRAFYPDHILLRNRGGQSIELLRFGVTLDTPATAVSDHNLLYADLRLVRGRR